MCVDALYAALEFRNKANRLPFKSQSCLLYINMHSVLTTQLNLLQETITVKGKAIPVTDGGGP
jgi:hypothetical protein